MKKFCTCFVILCVALNGFGLTHKDLNGNEFEVETAWDLPIGNYIHPDGYFEDVYYNSEGYKVLDVYYKGGTHVITTSEGHGESEGWISQGVSGGYVYAPNKIWDEFCVHWNNIYNTDKEFKRLVDMCKTIANESQYDWDYWYKGLTHDINRGFICDDYATLVKKTLAKQGYDVKIVSSSKANHAWNEVILPDGRKVYVDVTWFDYDYDSTNHKWKKQEYSIQWIVLEEDKEVFDHGFTGKRMEHYAFGDSQYK
jgi:hypothetical protein